MERANGLMYTTGLNCLSGAILPKPGVRYHQHRHTARRGGRSMKTLLKEIEEESDWLKEEMRKRKAERRADKERKRRERGRKQRPEEEREVIKGGKLSSWGYM